MRVELYLAGTFSKRVQPPVTGGKKATSAPSRKGADSSRITWSSAMRTALPQASASAWPPPRAPRRHWMTAK
jgi:hypothetical protein